MPHAWAKRINLAYPPGCPAKAEVVSRPGPCSQPSLVAGLRNSLYIMYGMIEHSESGKEYAREKTRKADTTDCLDEW